MKKKMSQILQPQLRPRLRLAFPLIMIIMLMIVSSRSLQSSAINSTTTARSGGGGGATAAKNREKLFNAQILLFNNNNSNTLKSFSPAASKLVKQTVRKPPDFNANNAITADIDEDDEEFNEMLQLSEEAAAACNQQRLLSAAASAAATSASASPVAHPAFLIATNAYTSVVFVVGIIGNCLVLITVTRYSKMHSVTNIFLCCLAISNLCFIVAIPLLVTAAVVNSWIFGTLLCKLFYSMTTLNQFTSSFFLTILALDRYIVTCLPFTLGNRRTTCKAIIACVLIWLVSIIMVIPVYVCSVVRPSIVRKGAYTCTIDFNWPFKHLANNIGSILYGFIVGFALPVTCIVYCYASVILRLRQMSDKFEISSSILTTTTAAVAAATVNDVDGATTTGADADKKQQKTNSSTTITRALLSRRSSTLTSVKVFTRSTTTTTTALSSSQSSASSRKPSKNSARKKKHNKVTLLVLAIITAYLICSTPYWVAQITFTLRVLLEHEEWSEGGSYEDSLAMESVGGDGEASRQHELVAAAEDSPSAAAVKFSPKNFDFTTALIKSITISSSPSSSSSEKSFVCPPGLALDDDDLGGDVGGQQRQEFNMVYIYFSIQCLMYTNSATNPIIVFFLNDNFHRTFLHIWHAFCSALFIRPLCCCCFWFRRKKGSASSSSPPPPVTSSSLLPLTNFRYPAAAAAAAAASAAVNKSYQMTTTNNNNSNSEKHQLLPVIAPPHRGALLLTAALTPEVALTSSHSMEPPWQTAAETVATATAATAATTTTTNHNDEVVVEVVMNGNGTTTAVVARKNNAAAQAVSVEVHH